MPRPVYLAHPPAIPQPHPKPPHGRKIGVLLVNLGTPDGTDTPSMRRYLSEFLSDRRVIELPRWLWWPILNGVILTTRPKKSGEAYASIWDRQKNASPLRVITEAQAADLQKRLGTRVGVRFAMRYGQPAIRTVLEEMMAEGYGKILIAPLYPQYAAATTGTVVDEVARWLLGRRWQPSLRTLPPYYDDAAYIEAVAGSVATQVKAAKRKPEVVMASFHGLPLAYCQKGDVYYCHSHKTARLLAEKLGMTFCRTVEEALAAKGKALLLTFQSRFGKQEWLQPYTDVALEALGRAGVADVMIVAPGFSADCVETLEELGIRGAEQFHEAGGKRLEVVPCLNDAEVGMTMLEALIRRELAGWVT